MYKYIQAVRTKKTKTTKVCTAQNFDFLNWMIRVVPIQVDQVPIHNRFQFQRMDNQNSTYVENDNHKLSYQNNKLSQKV